MKQVRKVVKDPILKGQNRGQVEDLRAQKMGEIDRARKDLGVVGGIHEMVDGFATFPFRCVVCGATNHNSKTPLAAVEAPCRSCGQLTVQERIW